MRTSFSHRVLSIASRGRRLDSDREPAHSRSRSDLDRYPTPNRPRSLDWAVSGYGPSPTEIRFITDRGQIWSDFRPDSDRERRRSAGGGERGDEFAGAAARLEELVASFAYRQDAHRDVGDACRGERREPGSDHVLVAGGQDVGHPGGVALVEQALVVG